MKKNFLLILLLLVILNLPSFAEIKDPEIPSVVFKGQEINLEKVSGIDKIFIEGIEQKKKFKIPELGNLIITIEKNGKKTEYSVYSIPGVTTIIPPLIAIILAMIFKDVIIAIFLGVFAGALLLNKFNILKSFFNVIDKYILNAVADHERASIVIFTLLLGGMVGIITKSGGFKGIVTALQKRVNSARSTQMYTWLMGIFIFFDDYTNTLIVGNTMRPLTDKWKISREKLAYIVDSTAAPMASLALISTWIGFEISLINQSLTAYGVKYDAYALLLSSIPLRFYSIISLIFVFFVFTLNKDYGPMYKAEKRARAGRLLNEKAVPLSDFEASGLNPSKFIKPNWINGIIPIIVVITVTFVGLYFSGKSILVAKSVPLGAKSFFSIIFSGSSLRDLATIISSADSFKVLLWASMMGVLSAIFLSFVQKILKLRESISAMVQGMKSMLMAIIILVMAWSLGVVLVELKTADYLVSILHSNLDIRLFPGIVFILSGVIAFSTGTSWGTISIMYPLVIPITIGLMATGGAGDLRTFLVLTISSVLAGSVFGDHCSPISDTTIMSSMASSCDHIDHVKTQLPYSLTVAAIALFGGVLPVSFGMPYIISLTGTVGITFLVLFFRGKKVGI
ncbi:MAG: Na+/H+ antiporter NhaC family protein [Acidobacteriota bacterium]